MLIKAAVALSLAGSLATPTQARVMSSRSAEVHAANQKMHGASGERQTATVSKNPNIRLALFPVYYYGCDNTESDPC